MIRAEEQSFSLIFFSFQKKFPSAPCGTSFFFKTNGLFSYDPKLDQQKTINLVKGLGKELRIGFWFPSSCLQRLTSHFSLHDWLRSHQHSSYDALYSVPSHGVYRAHGLMMNMKMCLNAVVPPQLCSLWRSTTDGDL